MRLRRRRSTLNFDVWRYSPDIRRKESEADEKRWKVLQHTDYGFF